MTEDMLKAVLATAQARTNDDGWSSMPEGRLVTLYAAHDGVGLTVAKIERLRVAHTVIHAENAKGETYLVPLADVFAASVEGKAAANGRKTGFLG